MSPRRADSGAGRSLFRRGFAGILGLLSAVALAGPGCADDSSALFGDSSGSGAAGGAGGAGGSEPRGHHPGPRRSAAHHRPAVRRVGAHAAGRRRGSCRAAPPADPQLLGLETIAASDAGDAPRRSSRATRRAAQRGRGRGRRRPGQTFAKLVPVPAESAPPITACLRKVVEAFAPLAWRRPLTEAETVRLVTAAGSGGGHSRSGRSRPACATR
jgi:hypothetical protein